MRKAFFGLLASTSMAVLGVATPAVAQTTPAKPAPTPSKEAEQSDKEIVVTGTQIRGATPAGATILTTTAAQAEEQGATNGNELLAQLPQAANVFQQLPSIAGGVPGGFQAASRLPFNAITLRNLPNVNTGGSPTLSLIDGHRVVPIGTDPLGGQGFDASSLSASTLLRTEIMPDGGSAVYGSDAVAGVINYITKDNFDGLQVQGRAGVARKYWQYDASVTAGTSWGSGSVYASAAFSYHDALFGVDRDYFRSVDANPSSPLYQTPLGLNCLAPNISITTSVSGVSSRRLYPLTGPGGTVQPYTTNSGTNGSGSTASSAGIAGGN